MRGGTSDGGAGHCCTAGGGLGMEYLAWPIGGAKTAGGSDRRQRHAVRGNRSRRDNEHVPSASRQRRGGLCPQRRGHVQDRRGGHGGRPRHLRLHATRRAACLEEQRRGNRTGAVSLYSGQGGRVVGGAAADGTHLRRDGRARGGRIAPAPWLGERRAIAALSPRFFRASSRRSRRILTASCDRRTSGCRRPRLASLAAAPDPERSTHTARDGSSSA